MKWTLIFFVTTLLGSAFAQRDFTPSSKRQAFGTRDFRNLSNTGLQFQLGGTYLMSKLNNEVREVRTETGELRGRYLHDPKGMLGAYAEIGLIHFPKKRSKLSLWLKTVLVSYYDWGLGFKYFRGAEQIRYESMNPSSGTVVSTLTPNYFFEYGNIYGRFSLHKNIHFKNKRKNAQSNFFLDNSLGVNIDYRVLQKTSPYAWSPMTDEQRYSKPLQVQLHYGLGFGFRLKRGAYLIPGVRVPLLGYQSTVALFNDSAKGSTVFGNPSTHWFSSKYWPLLFHVKYMFLFEKKVKGCPPVEINDQDKNTQQGR